MATASQLALVEYLSTSYHPDREYIDGQLQERNVGKREQARVQAILAAWFFNHEREWSVVVLTEQRIQVSPQRVRIPDVVLTSLLPQPEVLVDPPLLLVEILSPDDTYADLEQRTHDYQRMGVQTIWLIDPRARTARLCQGHAWTEETRLTVPGTPIALNLEDLFRHLEPSQP